jgi:hypothetical protein
MTAAYLNRAAPARPAPGSLSDDRAAVKPSRGGETNFQPTVGAAALTHGERDGATSGTTWAARGEQHIKLPPSSSYSAT